MSDLAPVYRALGGAPGCYALAEAFYARVAKDPVLRPLFPGVGFRCAIEQLSAFLVQFLGGPAEDSQHRWWLSLRESHARFEIGARERDAWMRLMNATLDEFPAGAELRPFFEQASAYVGQALPPARTQASSALSDRWDAQLALDKAVAAIAAGNPERAIALVPRCSRGVLPGLLARMIVSRNPVLLEYAHSEIRREASLIAERYAGRTLLHNAAAAGSVETVNMLIDLGADVHAEVGGHTPLYSVANKCTPPGGADVVHALVRASADVNADGGVQRGTALHMAARRGNVEVATALLDCGADINARDRKGATPLLRALNCKKAEVADLLIARGGVV